jgi:pimeloyl-ACP methyl ester carboxylesterase
MSNQLLRARRPHPDTGAGPVRAVGLLGNPPYQHLPVAAPDPSVPYRLLIVEFDDQGCGDLQRAQMQAVEEELAGRENEDPIVVVFVHGWKHNAMGTDENLGRFCEVLQHVVEVEALEAPELRRPVIGIFIGWRGLSLYGFGVLEQATFFGRKQAATRVSTGSVRELLGRLRHFAGARPDRKLVVIGHSFGGLIVFTAIAQSMIEAVALPGDPSSFAFADLVLLVNPAFEAVRYLPIHQLVELRSERKTFDPCQRPLLVTVTARNDTATGFWFPLARSLRLFAETVAGRRELIALLKTPGHIRWMRTHVLDKPGAGAVPKHRPRHERLRASFSPAHNAKAEAFAASRDPGRQLQFPGGAVLTQTAYDPNNPFWVIQATPSIINGHDGIWGDAFFDFSLHLVARNLGRSR